MRRRDDAFDLSHDILAGKLCILISYAVAFHIHTKPAGLHSLTHWLSYISHPTSRSFLSNARAYTLSPNPPLHKNPKPQTPQWLRNLLPFALLLANVILPVLVFSLLRNPCRLFLTKWLGLYVFLGAHLICVVAKAGCDEIFGNKSIAPTVPAGSLESSVGLNVEDGKIEGLEGPRRDVKVLNRRISMRYVLRWVVLIPCRCLYSRILYCSCK